MQLNWDLISLLKAFCVWFLKLLSCFRGYFDLWIRTLVLIDAYEEFLPRGCLALENVQLGGFKNKKVGFHRTCPYVLVCY